MSDEEEVVYVKKQKTIHYGSLEDQERAKIAKAENEGNENQSGSGQINISHEYFDIEHEM